ncbi:DUF5995 family protein [Williamsia sp. CHRR-6]|uniref:DUF5995 family protein n=1 Tax=Williamsia sp. CHRR-6 TaxID=2835871 RepID=UPI001BD9A1F3|nr:DUF5995 family protein [Williamsia sp. CHRR-6]MBT0566698.1 SRPBCC family protein [Williamsia sp. CHRR-6]
MSTIDLEAELTCSPEQAWVLITDPAQRNTWSTTRTLSSDAGGSDRVDRVGAVREVVISTPVRATVHQVVTHAEEPRRFEYEVFKGWPLLRGHHCRIDITPTMAGCAVRVALDVEFASGISLLASQTVRREVQKSLLSLSERSRVLPQVTTLQRTYRPTVPVQTHTEQLRSEAARHLAMQQRLAEELRAAGDPKVWFARLVALTTEEYLSIIDAGQLANPDWALSLLIAIHRQYVTTMHAYRSGGPLSTRWRAALGRCDESDARRPFRCIAVGVVSASRAHMLETMPRALAEVYAQNFRNTRHYKEFRADYIRLGVIYRNALQRLMVEVPGGMEMRILRWCTRVLPEVREFVLRTFYFDIEGERLRAFDTGYDIAREECWPRPQPGENRR